MCNSSSPILVIYKGEKSDSDGVKQPVINLITTSALTGYTAHFSFYGIEQDFTASEVSSKTLKLSYSATDTNSLPMGMSYATLTLKDSDSHEYSAKFVISVVQRDLISVAGLPVAIGAGYIAVT